MISWLYVLQNLYSQETAFPDIEKEPYILPLVFIYSSLCVRQPTLNLQYK